MMTETPLYFRNGRYQLFGILHEAPANPARPAFVFSHPFAEEKLWAHRVFVAFARRLAAAGYPVLRFDYMGQGDSEGDLRDASVATCLSDLACAIEQTKRMIGCDQIALLGLRLGATLASLAAEERSDIRALVLWAPIVDGARYMQELLRTNLTTQMAAYKEIRLDREALAAAISAGQAVNVDGYELAHPLYSEVSAIKLASPKRFRGPCLIAQVERRNTLPVPELQQLSGHYPSCEMVLTEEEPFWKEIPRWYSSASNLFQTTEVWLQAVGCRLLPHGAAVQA